MKINVITNTTSIYVQNFPCPCLYNFDICTYLAMAKQPMKFY